MKKHIFLVLLVSGLSAPALALAETDATSLLLQGLQNFGGDSKAAASSSAKTSTGLDQIKATVLAKAGMAAIDTNRDGTVSKQELATLTNRMFDLADKDHNGQLTEKELSDFAANINKVLSFLR